MAEKLLFDDHQTCITVACFCALLFARLPLHFKRFDKRNIKKKWKHLPIGIHKSWHFLDKRLCENGGLNKPPNAIALPSIRYLWFLWLLVSSCHFANLMFTEQNLYIYIPSYLIYMHMYSCVNPIVPPLCTTKYYSFFWCFFFASFILFYATSHLILLISTYLPGFSCSSRDHIS